MHTKILNSSFKNYRKIKILLKSVKYLTININDCNKLNCYRNISYNTIVIVNCHIMDIYIRAIIYCNFVILGIARVFAIKNGVVKYWYKLYCLLFPGGEGRIERKLQLQHHSWHSHKRYMWNCSCTDNNILFLFYIDFKHTFNLLKYCEHKK